MKPPDLTQGQIEELDEIDYSNFLAYGDSLMPELNDEEYDEYLKSYQLFDL